MLPEGGVTCEAVMVGWRTTFFSKCAATTVQPQGLFVVLRHVRLWPFFREIFRGFSIVVGAPPAQRAWAHGFGRPWLFRPWDFDCFAVAVLVRVLHAVLLGRR